MSHQPTDSKRLLSYTISEWACALKYEHLSPEAIQAAKLYVPKGDPRDPMTEDEIAVKFTALGGDVIGRDQCAKLQKFIMSMETAKNLGGLFELTTAR